MLERGERLKIFATLNATTVPPLSKRPPDYYDMKMSLLHKMRSAIDN